MASSYPHSMAPCRWFSNRKDCIWKHKPTIYTPNKQWDVNLTASTPCNPLLLTHPQPASFAWFCYGEANTSLGRITTRNGSLFLTRCLATKTCDAEEKEKKKMGKNLVAFTVNKSPTSLQRIASTNGPFRHNATFKSIIWTHQRQTKTTGLLESTTQKQSGQMLPLVSVRALLSN